MITDIDKLADEVHENAKSKGFHPADQPIETFIANQCNNMHGEIQELWEAERAGERLLLCDKASKMMDLGLPTLNCQEEELADIIIRALDVSRRLKIDIVKAINSKHEYNKTRPHMHGKKN